MQIVRIQIQIIHVTIRFIATSISQRVWGATNKKNVNWWYSIWFECKNFWFKHIGKLSNMTYFSAASGTNHQNQFYHMDFVNIIGLVQCRKLFILYYRIILFANSNFISLMQYQQISYIRFIYIILKWCWINKKINKCL